MPTRAEVPDPNHDGNPDDHQSTSLGGADYLSDDDDDDGVPTRDERPNGRDRDSDGDDIPDHLDDDDDGDLLFREGRRDTDGDGRVDALDDDDDDDGVPSAVESTRSDTDGDGIPDAYDDDDGDGNPTQAELGPGGSDEPRDTDGDRTPDYLDASDADADAGAPDDAGAAVPDAEVDAGADAGTAPHAHGRVPDPDDDYLEFGPGGKKDGCSVGTGRGNSTPPRWLWLGTLSMLALVARRGRSC